MAQNLAVVLLGGADEAARQDWPGKTGTEKVSILVDGIALNARENQFLKELLLQILDDHALSTKRQSLLLDVGPDLGLTNIAEICDNSVALLRRYNT
jgi:hypothetical protein